MCCIHQTSIHINGSSIVYHPLPAKTTAKRRVTFHLQWGIFIMGNLPPSMGNLPPSMGNLPPSMGNLPPSMGDLPPSRVTFHLQWVTFHLQWQNPTIFIDFPIPRSLCPMTPSIEYGRSIPDPSWLLVTSISGWRCGLNSGAVVWGGCNLKKEKRAPFFWKKGTGFWIYKSYPLGQMYGIFTYIWPKFMVSVCKYSIHGSFKRDFLEVFWLGFG